jgi:Flp pilus assembly protein TadG
MQRMANILRTLKSFGVDRRGSVAPILAIAAVPLLASVGAAVDYGHALASKTAMQAVLDSTALSLAKQISTGSSTPEAQQTFSASFFHPEVHNVTVSSNVSTAGGATTVALTAKGAVDTAFMGILGHPTVDIQANSTSYISTGTSGCVLALNTTENSAVALGGSTNVSLNDCSIYANSNSSAAVSVSGSATLAALSVGAVGTVSISSSNVTVTDGIASNIPATRDPYADVEVPPYSGCMATNLNVKTTLTIDPGVYCNGLTVNAGANLTLNPGVYYIDRGTFSANGGATVSGQGVTIIFTSSTGNNWANLTINGNAVVNLTAPIGGPTAGIVIFGDPKMAVGTPFKLNGGSSQVFGGAIYVPAGAVNYSGGAGTSTSCTQIIGDTVAFTGNSNVAINCSSYNTRPFGPTTLKLLS